jgi:hypothetical protein
MCTRRASHSLRAGGASRAGCAGHEPPRSGGAFVLVAQASRLCFWKAVRAKRVAAIRTGSCRPTRCARGRLGKHRRDACATKNLSLSGGLLCVAGAVELVEPIVPSEATYTSRTRCIISNACAAKGPGLLSWPAYLHQPLSACRPMYDVLRRAAKAESWDCFSGR